MEEFNYKPTVSQGPRVNNKLARFLPVVLGVVVILLIVAFVLNSRSSNNVADPGNRLHATSLQGPKNFGAIRGNDLYSYNGLAFYKTGLQSGDVTVLRSGIKLPNPTDIVWGDSGAVMTFDRSFAGSAVETAIRARGERLTAITKAYAWYVNFSDGSLSLVSNREPEPAATIYSAKDGGFYFVTRSDDDTTSLSFFDTTAKVSSTVAGNTGFLIMADLSLCDGYRLCFRMRDYDDSGHDKLLALDEGNKVKELFNSKGRIFATNDPNRFITIEDADSKDAKQSDQKKRAGIATTDAPEDADYPASPAKLYDLRNKTSTDLGFEIDQPTIDFRINSDNTFFAFDPSYYVEVKKEEQTAYRAGNISPEGKTTSSLFPLLTDAGAALRGQIVSLSYGTSATLITDTNDTPYLFGKTPVPSSLKAAAFAQAQKVVDDCKGTNAKDASYDDSTRTFIVELVDDDNFEAKIASFSRCVTGNGSTALSGYNYKFDGLDPINGRLSTD